MSFSKGWATIFRCWLIWENTYPSPWGISAAPLSEVSEDSTAIWVFLSQCSCKAGKCWPPLPHACLLGLPASACHGSLQVPPLLLALPRAAKPWVLCLYSWSHLDRAELKDMSQENCSCDDGDLISLVQHHPHVCLHHMSWNTGLT